jgi:hypothetical protein
MKVIAEIAWLSKQKGAYTVGGGFLKDFYEFLNSTS